MAYATNQIFINGRFLTQSMTGVQRFAREVVLAMDKLLAKEGIAPDFTLIAPEGTPPLPGLTRIVFMPYGKRSGHLWEQTDLRRATRGKLLVNLGPSGPLFKHEQFTVIHDAAVYRYPANYSFTYGAAHRLLGRMLARTSQLGTVSNFSRKELSEVLHVPSDAIAIIPNGYDHIQALLPDDAVIDRLQLRGRRYFIFVGSTTPNKNLARAIQAFAALGRSDVSFVIVGSSEKNVYRGGIAEKPANVLSPGRLTDEEIAALYRGATALVFPSLYEGFGIPPLEAMTMGCPVLAASIPPVEEVCGPAALYFDPLNVSDMANKMKEILESEELRVSLIAKGMERLALFSWRNSAQKLLSAILRGSNRP